MHGVYTHLTQIKGRITQHVHSRYVPQCLRNTTLHVTIHFDVSNNGYVIRRTFGCPSEKMRRKLAYIIQASFRYCCASGWVTEARPKLTVSAVFPFTRSYTPILRQTYVPGLLCWKLRTLYRGTSPDAKNKRKKIPLY